MIEPFVRLRVPYDDVKAGIELAISATYRYLLVENILIYTCLAEYWRVGQTTNLSSDANGKRSGASTTQFHLF